MASSWPTDGGARRRRRPGEGALLAAPLGLLLLGAFFVPLALLLADSFGRQEGFHVVHTVTLAAYRAALGDHFYLRLLGRSLAIGAIVGLASVALAYPYAYIATFRYPRLRSVLLFAALLSLFTSYLARVYAFQSILGESGVINTALLRLGVVHAPVSFLLFNAFAVVITLVNVFFPFALLPIWGAMQNVDPLSLEAARDLGARPFAAFWRVVYPATRGGAMASFVFCFVLASGDYVTPTLVGGTNGLMIGRAIADAFGLLTDYPLGAALAFVLLLAYGLLIGVLPWVLRRLPRPGAFRAAGLGFLRATGRVNVPGARYWAPVYLSAALVYLFAPLVIIVVLSFTTRAVPAFPMHGVTLHWYRELFANSTFVSALETSLKVAGMTAAAAVILGTLAALALARVRGRASGAASAYLIAPLAMPGLITGVAMLSFYVARGISLGTTTITIGHLVYAVPFATLALVARLRDLDPTLIEAGHDLGRGPAGVFRKVTLPLVAPAIIAAAVVAAALSLDEFVITNFVSGSSVTLPLFIWAQLRIGVTPATNAVCALILAGLVVLAAVSFGLTRILATSPSGRSR